jgi:hypothetical protein
LQTENFSPGYADRFIPWKRSALDDYLADKEKGPKSWEFKDILEASPTNARVMQNSPSYFTFDTVQDEEISQVFGYNKRKFGKKWEKKRPAFLSPQYLSAETTPRYASALKKLNPQSPQESLKKLEIRRGNFIKNKISVNLDQGKIKLPPIQLKIPKQKQGHRKFNSMEEAKLDIVNKSFDLASGNIPNKPEPSRLGRIKNKSNDEGAVMRKFINDFMEKSLGIKKKGHQRFESKFENRENSFEKLSDFVKPEKNSKNEKKGGKIKDVTGFDDEEKEKIIEKDKEKAQIEDDRQFLASGYLNYNNDLENKLRVQKMVTAQHRYERKMTLINFPPLKLINSENN